MAYLLITSGQSAGDSFDLEPCPLSVGRDARQDIQLRDCQVSGEHLLIDRLPDGTYAVKTQPSSKHGMIVNDDVVSHAALANGDRIRIGETEMLFLATDQASQVEAVKRVRVWMHPPAPSKPPAADADVTARSTPHDPPIATQPPQPAEQRSAEQRSAKQPTRRRRAARTSKAR